MRIGMIILGTVLMCAGTAQAKTVLERAEQGEVVIQAKKRGGANAVRVTALFNAPMTKLWAIIDKCGDYERTMRRIKDSVELSRKGNKIRCRTIVDMPFPLGDLSSITEAVHTVVPGKSYQRKWKLVKGDYELNQGSWTITPHSDGKRSLVVYQVLAKPNIAVPGFIQRWAQKKSLPDLFEHLRKQVE